MVRIARLLLATTAFGVAFQFLLLYWSDSDWSSYEGDLISPSNTDEDDDPNHNNINDKRLLPWLREQRNRSLPDLPLIAEYRCQSGLGHQLLRLSSAYHLFMTYEIPRIKATANPMCGGSIDTIYDYLIGGGQLFVDMPYRQDNLFQNRSLFKLPTNFRNLKFVNETTLSNKAQQSLKRYININNEVQGYMSARVSRHSFDDLIQNEYYGKDQSDYQLYNQMMVLFGDKHSTRVQSFMNQMRFHQHTVFGLHIRAGNGEKGDFANKQRGMPDLDNWLESFVFLFCDYKERNDHYFRKYPLMIFVATDTASVIPKLQMTSNMTCQIPIASVSQTYPEEGEGVSFIAFTKKEQQDCLDGWRDMVLDMYILTQCNTVIAGTYSSFTQAAPLSFVMQKAKQYNHKVHNTYHPHYFCEMGIHGKYIECFETLSSWLKRDDMVLVWGNKTVSPRQRVRQEIFFPASGDPSHIRLFGGTALMAP